MAGQFESYILRGEVYRTRTREGRRPEAAQKRRESEEERGERELFRVEE